jgi:hypothetical protein
VNPGSAGTVRGRIRRTEEPAMADKLYVGNYTVNFLTPNSDQLTFKALTKKKAA